jgi:exopolysaccharide production protein ExoZ
MAQRPDYEEFLGAVGGRDRPLPAIGGIGVEPFFIVSGYVMCLRVPKYTSGLAFLKARVVRIMPMYWIFTSLVVAVYFIYPQWRLNSLTLSTEAFVLSYLILPQRAYPILGVGRSLEHEMIFYASLAVLMLTCGALLRPPRYFVAR